MEGLVNSIFEPGVNQSLLIATNFAFFVLLSVLVLIAVFVDLNIHVIFISILTTLLWIAINWFILEMATVTPAEPVTNADIGADDSGHASAGQDTDTSASSSHAKAE
eukprot:scpid99173/ scgid12672/ 